MPDLSYAFLTSLTDGQLPDLDEKEFLKWNIPILQVFFIKTPIGIVSTY